MSQGERKGSITQLRKWNLVAGGIDPRNDVIPASVGYGLEEGLQFAVSEITRLEERIKRLEEAGDGLMKSINCGCPYGPSVFNCQTCTNSWDAWRKAKEAKP